MGPKIAFSCLLSLVLIASPVAALGTGSLVSDVVGTAQGVLDGSQDTLERTTRTVTGVVDAPDVQRVWVEPGTVGPGEPTRILVQIEAPGLLDANLAREIHCQVDRPDGDHDRPCAIEQGPGISLLDGEVRTLAFAYTPETPGEHAITAWTGTNAPGPNAASTTLVVEATGSADPASSSSPAAGGSGEPLAPTGGEQASQGEQPAAGAPSEDGLLTLHEHPARLLLILALGAAIVAASVYARRGRIPIKE